MGSATPVNSAAADRRRAAAARPQHSDQLPLRDVWVWGGTGAIMLWLCFPPVGWSLLGWVALAPWTRLLSDPRRWSGRHYRHLYVVGLLYWLVLLQWVRLPHWSTYFGWLALSGYLAVYVPAFVIAARWQVHRWRLPSLLVVPLVWTACELARGRLFTGFAMALLAHSQVDFPAVMQVADLGGAYLVSLTMAAVAACVERMVPLATRRRSLLVPMGTAVLVLALALIYGQVRSARFAPTDEAPARVALIQGSIDTTFDDDPEVPLRTFEQYRELTERALARDGQVEVVIWPESMFTPDAPLVSIQEPLRRPASWPEGDKPFDQRIHAYREHTLAKTRWAGQRFGVPMIVGAEWWDAGPWGLRRHNSAVWLDARGTIRGRYDKMHPVMFGEYVPLGELFPWLYRLTPMSGGLTPGNRPQLFECGPLRFSPSICFENLVPHLIRRQVVKLQQSGQAPNCLVTVTNDGWFWGSSGLDLHLAGAAFRAVENRMPLVIAANTGFSAAIDARGRILAQGPRRQPAPIITAVHPNSGRTVYQAAGDLPLGLCLLVTAASLVSALRQAWFGRHRP